MNYIILVFMMLLGFYINRMYKFKNNKREKKDILNLDNEL